MTSHTRGLRVPAGTRSSAVDAARLALARPPLHRTPGRERILRAATVLWCRELQLPTVREVARSTGHSSPSGVITPFGRCVDLQAVIIRTEWDLLVPWWQAVPAEARGRWLAEHARQLEDMDRACLRLPGLVCSAVASAEVVPLPPLELLTPLHALASLAGTDSGVDPHALAAAAASLAGRPGRTAMAVSA